MTATGCLDAAFIARIPADIKQWNIADFAGGIGCRRLFAALGEFLLYFFTCTDLWKNGFCCRAGING